MRWVNVRCEGYSPLLMVRGLDPHPELLQNVWQNGSLESLIIPMEHLVDRLVYAGSDYFGASRTKMSRWTAGFREHYGIAADVLPLQCPITSGSRVWEESVHRVQGSTRGQWTILSLPRVDRWGFLLPLWYDETRYGPKLLMDIVQHCGEVGLGALAPHFGCGQFGRFRVHEWNEFTECPAEMAPFMPKQVAEPAAAPVEAVAQ